MKCLYCDKTALYKLGAAGVCLDHRSFAVERAKEMPTGERCWARFERNPEGSIRSLTPTKGRKVLQ